MSDHDGDSRWEDIYKDGDVESLPWFYTGPGTQAIAMAELGYSVTAVDIAGTAVKKACIRTGSGYCFPAGGYLQKRSGPVLRYHF